MRVSLYLQNRILNCTLAMIHKYRSLEHNGHQVPAQSVPVSPCPTHPSTLARVLYRVVLRHENKPHSCILTAETLERAIDVDVVLSSGPLPTATYLPLSRCSWPGKYGRRVLRARFKNVLTCRAPRSRMIPQRAETSTTTQLVCRILLLLLLTPSVQ